MLKLKRPLSKKQSRSLAVGLLILCLLLGGLLLFIPVRMLHRMYDQTRDERADYLQRYQRISATRPEIQAALDRLKKLDGRKHFLKSTGAALAASEIQETAKSVIESSGGRLNSMQVVTPKEEGGYRRISVTIQMIGTLTALRKIMYAVETMQPYLFVDNVSFRAQPQIVFRAPVPGVEPEMNAQFDLAGYALLVGSK